MKHKALDDSHFRDCHRRWSKFRNRDLDQENRPDEWLKTQCLFCACYVPLVGKFSEDYGVCTNGNSRCDGRVMFEHDGCDDHLQSAEFLQFSISYVSAPMS
jgi:hypothetical protein